MQRAVCEQDTPEPTTHTTCTILQCVLYYIIILKNKIPTLTGSVAYVAGEQHLDGRQKKKKKKKKKEKKNTPALEESKCWACPGVGCGNMYVHVYVRIA